MSAEKKFCLFVAIAYALISLITHTSCFRYGFIVGAAFSGFLLLKDKVE